MEIERTSTFQTLHTSVESVIKWENWPKTEDERSTKKREFSHILHALLKNIFAIMNERLHCSGQYFSVDGSVEKVRASGEPPLSFFDKRGEKRAKKFDERIR